jgi:hypothetical protein
MLDGCMYVHVWYVYDCIWMYIWLQVQQYIHIIAHTHIHSYMYVRSYVTMHTHTYIYAHTHIVPAHTCNTCIYMHWHTYTYVYKYTHAYNIYAHMVCISTYMHVCCTYITFCHLDLTLTRRWGKEVAVCQQRKSDLCNELSKRYPERSKMALDVFRSRTPAYQLRRVSSTRLPLHQ